MEKDYIIEQINMLLSNVNNELPDVFYQIIVQGYIHSITGIIVILLFTILINVLIYFSYSCCKNDEDDKAFIKFLLILVNMAMFFVLLIPIYKIINIIFTPKAYIILQLLGR